MRGIDWSRSTATVNDLTVSILGLAAESEGFADLVAAAYIDLLPDSIAAVLIKRFPLPSADLVALIGATVEREGYVDMAALPAEYDRLAQVRNDLAHSDIGQDRDHDDRWRLYNHRGRAPKALPETMTLDDLRGEVDRAMEVRANMTGLAYRLGGLGIINAANSPRPPPEYGPGPRPVRRDRQGNEIGDITEGLSTTVK